MLAVHKEQLDNRATCHFVLLYMCSCIFVTSLPHSTCVEVSATIARGLLKCGIHRTCPAFSSRCLHCLGQEDFVFYSWVNDTIYMHLIIISIGSIFVFWIVAPCGLVG